MRTVSFRYPMPEHERMTPEAIDGLVGQHVRVNLMGLDYEGKIAVATETQGYWAEPGQPEPQYLWITLDLVEPEQGEGS